jgi:hypothetical protein
VLLDFRRGRGVAEARHVLVLPGLFLAAPGVIGVGDLLDVFVGQFAVDAVHQCPQLAGVNEERLALALPRPLAGRDEDGCDRARPSDAEDTCNSVAMAGAAPSSPVKTRTAGP